ncbi:MAG: glycosyltransferase family 4 protein [Bradyrhizobium sp.]|uniref:glycosyltransferase family 4 protein n=1 Tax=Bradyrhizobium sp. TaxID=376 RepID=UPI003D12A0D3
MRILWVSNTPLTPSGYGTQTAAFVPRLKAAGHDLAIVAFYGCEGSLLDWNGVTIYPRHTDPYGNDIIGEHAKHFGAECILSLIDAWVMDPSRWGDVPWVAWAPVDTDPISLAVAQKLRLSAQPIAYSRFGEMQMRSAGLQPLYVPHGIDTNVYRPMPRNDARGALGWPQDKFIVGMVAANKGYPGRKAWEQQIRAFADLRRKHPESVLYIHALMAPDHDGLNLKTMTEYFGLRPGLDVGWCDQYRYATGMYTNTEMATLYSGCDVLMNVAYGEGFGLPILEAQSCGTPVIVGDWTAMGELCFAGWAVPKGEVTRLWWPLVSEWRVPHAGAITDCLMGAYEAAGQQHLRTRAREGALAYDADRVMADYWQPALAAIEDRILDVPVATCVAPMLRRAA